MEKRTALKVGVTSLPPLIMKKPKGFQGFEIELWEEITRHLHVHYTLIEFPFRELLPALEAGAIDVALGGITMTSERERKIDFSHSTFDSGLGIIVPLKKKMFFANFFNRDLVKVFGIFVVYIIASANLIWLAERNGTGTLRGSYFQGIFNAIWWAVATASTIGYGDYIPVTMLGRVIGLFVILGGISIFGLFIAEVTSSFTVQKIHSTIIHPDDLRGKRVGTREKTVSAEALEELGAAAVLDEEIEQSYKRLENGDVDAVVFDAPTLLHYVSHEGKGKAVIVGDIFKKQHYAIALVQNSAIREGVNRIILQLYDNGSYLSLYQKWFGKEG